MSSSFKCLPCAPLPAMYYIVYLFITLWFLDHVMAIKVIPLFLHCAPSTVHNIATSKMAAVLPTSAKRINKSRFYRAEAFIRNNNAADRLTASWFAIEKQENERNVRDPEVCSGFSLRGRRVVELLKCPG